MRRVGFMITMVLVLSAASSAVAQQQPPPSPAAPPQPGTVVSPMRPQIPTNPTMGYGTLMSLLQRPQTAAAQPGEPGYPMFQLVGPENRASFWADPEAAGNALILQGELMMKMGEVMVKQGRELLDKTKKRPE